jgi:FecR protein
MSSTSLRRLTVLCLGVLALILAANPVRAEKVGVAAAVKPDAFSEGKEVKIGNSVFYNQRINTTGEGLVQVLLVDGSTFTVGPGSDLVIDKFVYDPSKGKGEVVASLSKGVVRFIGGKLSKNEGGVTVNTPSGALAIRGGMFQLKVDGHHMLASFLFGVEMTIKNNGQFQRLFQIGYTYDNGIVRPTTPDDTAVFMKALSGGGHVVAGNPNSNRANFGSNFLKKLTTAEVQEEGTQSIIIGQLDNEEHPVDNPPPPPPPPPSGPSGGEVGGYAGGMYVQYRDGNNDDEPVGGLASVDPSDVVVSFDDNTQTFKGATLKVFADQGGGAKIDFVPYQPFANSDHISPSISEGDSPFSGVAIVGSESDAGSISIYHDTDFSSGSPQLTNLAHVNSGFAVIVGLPTDAICDNCKFLKWGAFAANFNFDNQNHEGSNSVLADGFWVTGNMTSSTDLGDLRNSSAQATYSGRAWASVVSLNNENQWNKYAAGGNMGMNWNFGQRKGVLEISNFDSQNFDGGLDFKGNMIMPGVVNKFSGDLAGVNLPASLSGMNGFAQGSFVKGPSSPAQGVIGNWNVGTLSNHYSATGVFAGSGNPH